MSFRFGSRWLIAVGVCLVGAATPSVVSAQSNTLFGGSGALSGSGGLGAGSVGGGMGTAFGSNALPSNALPSNAMPTNALPSNALPGMTGTTGTTGQTQRAGLVGQQNARFIGQTPTTATPTTGQNQRGQNRTGNRAGQGQNQGGANQQQQRTIRPQLVVAFSTPRPAADVLSDRISTRLTKIAKTVNYEGVTVEVEGRNIVLRGEVDSAEAKRMASMLVKLEPGVRSVRNELVVKAEPAPSGD